ncbi:hypothetical protein SIN8267_03463 [Sinobacterium norvegicum]|uniref:Heparin-sulfate lyase N-terminal domain-containing protein n=1 Tax=Sinobacterium norvegicum TaxID=1641715 RepID=A0ABM9AKM0_9GAMM|nr:hypothetical protein SIN8267_03463 [Sinobacterium norvegicum]
MVSFFDNSESFNSFKPFNFKFLNVSHCFENETVDWELCTVSRLWRYNLHYFEFLSDGSRSDIEKISLIQQWIDKNPVDTGTGWEPYCVSLRIVSWIKYFSCRDMDVPAEALKSLYQQCIWLESNLELHILANHYFENIKAIYLAGLFFKSRRADRWASGYAIKLNEQIVEQFLPDGGHYERSSLYHQVITKGLLELFSFTESVENPELNGLIPLDFLEQYICRALDFSQQIVFPNGDLPNFNDASSVPCLTEWNMRYAESVNIFSQGHIAEAYNYKSSGYAGIKLTNDMFVMKTGPVGPDYQPGHTHCDILSYELMLAGSKVIVDTGVYEYQPGECRAHCRSTQAHNTVQVAGYEQTEVWGDFRVARRVSSVECDLNSSNNSHRITGAYKGFFARPAGLVSHTRAVDVTVENDAISCLEINDIITASGSDNCVNRIHLHPSIIPVLNDEDTNVYLYLEGDLIAKLNFKGFDGVSIMDTEYYPDFGVREANKCLVLSSSGYFPQSFSYSIEVVLK